MNNLDNQADLEPRRRTFINFVSSSSSPTSSRTTPTRMAPDKSSLPNHAAAAAEEEDYDVNPFSSSSLVAEKDEFFSPSNLEHVVGGDKNDNYDGADANGYAGRPSLILSQPFWNAKNDNHNHNDDDYYFRVSAVTKQTFQDLLTTSPSGGGGGGVSILSLSSSSKSCSFQQESKKEEDGSTVSSPFSGGEIHNRGSTSTSTATNGISMISSKNNTIGIISTMKENDVDKDDKDEDINCEKEETKDLDDDFSLLLLKGDGMDDDDDDEDEDGDGDTCSISTMLFFEEGNEEETSRTSSPPDDASDGIFSILPSSSPNCKKNNSIEQQGGDDSNTVMFTANANAIATSVRQGQNDTKKRISISGQEMARTAQQGEEEEELDECFHNGCTFNVLNAVDMVLQEGAHAINHHCRGYVFTTKTANTFTTGREEGVGRYAKGNAAATAAEVLPPLEPTPITADSRRVHVVVPKKIMSSPNAADCGVKQQQQPNKNHDHIVDCQNKGEKEDVTEENVFKILMGVRQHYQHHPKQQQQQKQQIVLATQSIEQQGQHKLMHQQVQKLPSTSMAQEDTSSTFYHATTTSLLPPSLHPIQNKKRSTISSTTSSDITQERLKPSITTTSGSGSSGTHDGSSTTRTATSLSAARPTKKICSVYPTASVVGGNENRQEDYNATTNTLVQEKDQDNHNCDSNNNRFRIYQAEQWWQRLQDMMRFKQAHGHCNVPNPFPSNPFLVQWVKRQRYQYKLKREGKHSTLTDEREAILQNMGFTWHTHGALWAERWNELKAFHETFGHSNVPTIYPENRQLAIWVKCQRRQYRLYKAGDPKSNMTIDRIRKLELLDFVWQPKVGAKTVKEKEELASNI